MLSQPARPLRLLLLVLAAALSVDVGGNQPNSSLSGVIVDGLSREPVAEASVSLVGQSAATRQVQSDAGGRFRFDRLDGGNYMIIAAKVGFVSGAYRQASPIGTPGWLHLPSGATRGDLVVSLWRPAAVSGLVLGADERPPTGLAVHALRLSQETGHNQFVTSRTTQPDGRGRYEIAGLLPGRYLLAVTSTGTQPFPAQFYPQGASAQGGAVLNLGPGEHLRAIDFRVRAQSGFSVVGRVVGPAGAVAGLRVQLDSAEESGALTNLGIATATTGKQGEFRFVNVIPGRYRLRGAQYRTWNDKDEGHRLFDAPMAMRDGALAPVPFGPGYWFDEGLSVVGDNIGPILVEAQPGFQISGSIQFEGGIDPPGSLHLPSRGIHIWELDRFFREPHPLTRIEADRRFESVPLPPGRYQIGMFRTYPGWSMAAVLVADLDRAGFPIEVRTDLRDIKVVLTDKPSKLTGTVRVRGGAVDPADSTVVVFSSERALWGVPAAWLPSRVVAMRPFGDGRYGVDLLPGTYYAAALQGDIPADWRTASFLERLVSFAVTVRVEKRTSTTRDLQLIPTAKAISDSHERK